MVKSFHSYLNAKTRTPEQIAKKHGCDVEHIIKSLKAGMKVEKEHSTNPKVQREIALDHLWEKPDYYVKLKKVEG